MTIYFIIFIILVILLASISKWNFKKKMLVLLLFFFVSLFTYTLLFYLLWNSSSHNEGIKQAQEFVYTNLKKITIINIKNEVIDCSVNFEYSKSEIKNKDLQIVDYYNKQSIVRLEPKAEFTITLPILKNEKLNFPDNFFITLKDSSKRIIKKYDEKDFFKNAISKPVIKSEIEKYKAEEWVLELK